MADPRRILITGSRTWTNTIIIERALADAWSALGHGDDIVLVSGACPTGADAIAETIWATRGWPIERHPAQWNLHGKPAGHIRNHEMVNLGADICLAFIHNESPGATGCAKAARKAGIPVRTYPSSDRGA